MQCNQIIEGRSVKNRATPICPYCYETIIMGSIKCQSCKPESQTRDIVCIDRTKQKEILIIDKTRHKPKKYLFSLIGLFFLIVIASFVIQSFNKKSTERNENKQKIGDDAEYLAKSQMKFQNQVREYQELEQQIDHKLKRAKIK